MVFCSAYIVVYVHKKKLNALSSIEESIFLRSMKNIHKWLMIELIRLINLASTAEGKAIIVWDYDFLVIDRTDNIMSLTTVR